MMRAGHRSHPQSGFWSVSRRLVPWAIDACADRATPPVRGRGGGALDLLLDLADGPGPHRGQGQPVAVRADDGQHHPGHHYPHDRPGPEMGSARDRGAACELISTDPATGAGVAFVRLEADPDPVRVRAGWVTDAHIRAMAYQIAEDTRPLVLEGVSG